MIKGTKEGKGRVFNFDVPSGILAILCERFGARYRLCDNVFCKYLWRFFHAYH